MQFNCTKCGACCKHIGEIRDTLNINFPYEIIDNVCSMLDRNNLCTVYANRPEICNVSYMKRYFPNLSEDMYLQLNYLSCARLIQITNA